MEEVTMNEEAETMEIDVSKVLEMVEKKMEVTTDVKTLQSLLTHYEKLQTIAIKAVTLNNDIYKIDVNKEIEMAKIESQKRLKEMEIASNEKMNDIKVELEESKIESQENLKKMEIASNEKMNDIKVELEESKIESQENLKKMEIASNEKIDQARRELQEALSLKEQRTSTRNEFIKGGLAIGAAAITSVVYLMNNKNNRRFIHALDIMHLNYDKTGIISSISKDDLRTAMNTLDIKARF